MYSRAYIEITNACNMSCSFCHGHSRAPRIMTRNEFERLTDELCGVTEYVYYHVMGEPTTHPELCDFIRLASGKGLRSVVTTNGTLLDRVGDQLIASGVYKVNVSIHSFEGNDQEKYHNYIEKCLIFADLASAAGILVILRLWNNGHDGGRNADILARMREKFVGCEWREVANGARIRHRLHLEYGDRFEWPDMSAHDGGEGVFCHALSDHFAILCDGSVVPCCLDADGVMTLGNAYSEPLLSILGGERAECIRRGFAEKKAREELCRRCGYARRFRI